MPLEQFIILLDNPTASYFPGQIVSGRVLIRTTSEKKSQGITLKFDGKSTVHWTETHTESSGTADNKTDRRVEKSFDDSDTYFEFTSYLLGDGRSEAKIPPGESSYPFSFLLPPLNLPSSYVGQHGKVEYTLEANVKRSWKFDYNVKQHVTVNALVDLNNDPEAGQPGEWNTSKTFCCLCCASGPLTMNIRLKSKGFCPGEIIPLEVEVNNLSTRIISDLSTEIGQQVTFYAQGSKNLAYKKIISAKRGQGVPAGESEIWRAELIIPPVPPSKLGGCRIIDVTYVMKVTVHVTGVATNLKKEFPIIIGTIPLRSRFNELQATESDVVPSAPPMFAPNGYPDLPPPQYQDSYNFKQDSPKDESLIENIASRVIDNIPAPEPDYIPKYPTYGWNINIK